MIRLGDYNTLRIKKRTDFGLYLDGGDEAGNILLPNRYVTPQMRLGQDVEVFLYLDQEERLVATTERPLARVGEFACLEVAWTNEYGAFLSWGLMKDLFCPFREQKQRMERGHSYIVYVKQDEDTYRLMATAKVEKYIQKVGPRFKTPDTLPKTAAGASPAGRADGQGSAASTEADAEPAGVYKHGDAVDVLVWQKTDLGFKAIVDNRYQGQLYDDQLFQPLHTGMRLTAYIDHIRQDGKIDLTLQPTGRRHTLDFAEQLLRYLHENDGRCDLGDKSPAELIYDRFKVSKKAYKKAVGDLYRRRLIVITAQGISLV